MCATLSSQTRRRSNRKVVRFAPSPATAAPSAPHRLPPTEEEISDMWYSPDELDKLKNDALEDARRLMQLRAAARGRCAPADDDDDGDREEERDRPRDAMRRPRHMSGETETTEGTDEWEDGPCYRGLEVRVTSDRMHGRRAAVRSVLEAQSRLRDGRWTTEREPSVVLSIVAGKLARPAGGMARLTGRSDFLQARRVYKGQPDVLEAYQARRGNGCPVGVLPRKRKVSCLTSLLTTANDFIGAAAS